MSAESRARRRRSVVVQVRRALASIVFAVVATNVAVWAIGRRAIDRASDAGAAGLSGDAIVVLGAGVWSSGPSPVLEDRLREALALYEAGVAPRIVVTGDHVRPEYDEPGAMERWLVAHGVPAERITLDPAGVDTYTSMFRAREVFHLERPIVVTQDFHLPRALFIARYLGLAARGREATHRRYSGNPLHAAREIVSRPASLLDCVRRRTPHPVVVTASSS